MFATFAVHGLLTRELARAVPDRIPVRTGKEHAGEIIGKGAKVMREEALEETIRLEIEQQAERFGVNYYELSPNVQSWLRSLVIAQLYGKDTGPAVSPETGEEE
jgi:hypothetical protein